MVKKFRVVEAIKYGFNTYFTKISPILLANLFVYSCIVFLVYVSSYFLWNIRPCLIDILSFQFFKGYFIKFTMDSVLRLFVPYILIMIFILGLQLGVQKFYLEIDKKKGKSLLNIIFSGFKYLLSNLIAVLVISSIVLCFGIISFFAWKSISYFIVKFFMFFTNSLNILGLVENITKGVIGVLIIIIFIYYLIRILFTALLILDKNMGPIEAIKTSYNMSKPHGLKIFLLLFLYVTTFLLTSLILNFFSLNYLNNLLNMISFSPIYSLALIYVYRKIYIK